MNAASVLFIIQIIFKQKEQVLFGNIKIKHILVKKLFQI